VVLRVFTYNAAMNSLETYLKSHGLEEVETLNKLQDFGKVSDLCVTAADVAEADCKRAIAFLETEALT